MCRWMSTLQHEDQIGGGLKQSGSATWPPRSGMPNPQQLDARRGAFSSRRRVAARSAIAMAARCFEIAQDGLLAFRLAQSFVKGFSRERLVGAESRPARIMSMSARNAAGTCRRPG